MDDGGLCSFVRPFPGRLTKGRERHLCPMPRDGTDEDAWTSAYSILTRTHAALGRARIFSFDLRCVRFDATNDGWLAGDDPDDVMRSASATSASAISS
jgi:hypothetical protein